MIEKFRIKQFCCCCNTRTGSLVIGIFGWMGSLLQAMTLSSQPETQKIVAESDNTIVVETTSSPNVGTICICIFMFGISVSLVIGIYKDSRNKMLPWLIIKFLECCVLTIITIVIFFLLFVSEPDIVLPMFFIFIIIGLLTALCWYCFICVWSLYMDMGETTLTYVPTGTGQSIPMTEPPAYEQHPNYNPPMETKPQSPMQEMV